jgi:hypothetical protein
MSVVRSLSPLDLEKVGPPTSKPAVYPDPELTFGGVLADAWWQKWRGQPEKERAMPELPFRASMSGSCSRQIWFYCHNTTVTEPETAADVWRANLGTIVHELFQDELAVLNDNEEIDSWSIEDNVDLSSLGIRGSGHQDLYVLMSNGRKILVELKTAGGFAFKKSTTQFKGPGEGPKYGHIIQACLLARAMECDEVHIVYMSLECISKGMTLKLGLDSEYRRFVAEWTYDLADEELSELLDRETARIIDAIESETPPNAWVVDNDTPA